MIPTLYHLLFGTRHDLRVVVAIPPHNSRFCRCPTKINFWMDAHRIWKINMEQTNLTKVVSAKVPLYKTRELVSCSAYLQYRYYYVIYDLIHHIRYMYQRLSIMDSEVVFFVFSGRNLPLSFRAFQPSAVETHSRGSLVHNCSDQRKCHLEGIPSNLVKQGQWMFLDDFGKSGVAMSCKWSVGRVINECWVGDKQVLLLVVRASDCKV